MGKGRLLVLGAGAVGTFVGALLAADYDVVLVGREGLLGPAGTREIKAVLRDQTDVRADLTVCHTLTDVPSDWNPDGVLLTMKFPALRQSLPSITEHHKGWGRPWLVTFQNGVGSEELVLGSFPHELLVSGTVTMSVTLDHGVAQQHSRGGVALAPLSSGRGNDCRALATTFAGHGILCRCITDYQAMKWSKLLLNQVANGICGLTGLMPIEVISSADLFALEAEAARETLDVMQALSIRPVDLPGYPVKLAARLFRLLPVSCLQRTLGKKIARSRGDKLPSLMIDVEKGRTNTEAEVMYGTVAATGKRLGVDTPVCYTIAELFRQGRQVTPRELIEAVGHNR